MVFCFHIFSCKINCLHYEGSCVDEPCDYQGASHALSSLILTVTYEIGTILTLIIEEKAAQSSCRNYSV